MNQKRLRQIIETEMKKQSWLATISADSKRGSGPFLPVGSFGWFEMFLRHALDTVPANSPQWAEIAEVYTDTVDRSNFCNLVLGMLMRSDSINEDRLITFAYVMRHNRDNLDFLIEDLESVAPTNMWIAIMLRTSSIPLWKAILIQYKAIEQLTGNMFLSLYTQDAVEYYIQDRFPTKDVEIRGSMSTDPFVLATYNFKAMLEAI
jgi:hypothetical protein